MEQQRNYFPLIPNVNMHYLFLSQMICEGFKALCLCAYDNGDRERKQVPFLSLQNKGASVLLFCVCVYKRGGSRQTGSGGLQNRTGHRNSSWWSPATDRQATMNADISLIRICHQRLTKGIHFQGNPPDAVLNLKTYLSITSVICAPTLTHISDVGFYLAPAYWLQLNRELPTPFICMWMYIFLLATPDAKP